jgi:hypothetical protein
LAWTEALTQLDRKADYGPLRAALHEYFSEAEISCCGHDQPVEPHSGFRALKWPRRVT